MGIFASSKARACGALAIVRLGPQRLTQIGEYRGIHWIQMRSRRHASNQAKYEPLLIAQPREVSRRDILMPSPFQRLKKNEQVQIAVKCLLADAVVVVALVAVALSSGPKLRLTDHRSEDPGSIHVRGFEQAGG
jgi:hypothetical protein